MQASPNRRDAGGLKDEPGYEPAGCHVASLADYGRRVSSRAELQMKRGGLDALVT